MSNKARYRAGVIGCGRIGSGLDDPWFDQNVRDESWRARPCTHAGIYMAHPRIELIAGADTNEDRLNAFSRRWGIGHTYRDYREMLRQERLDIVSITTSSEQHAEMTIAAAEAGVKAIFCEKPIACSLAEADEMIRVCEASQTRLIINHTLRFHPAAGLAQKLIETGAIGALRSMTAYFDRWLIHMGSHLFDLMCLFAGEPRWVAGHIHGDPSVDTEGTGYIGFASGVIGLFDIRPRAAPAYLELMGATGMIAYGDDSEMTLRLYQRPASADPHVKPGLEERPAPAIPPQSQECVPRQGRFTTRCAVDEVVACLDEDRESVSGGRQARWALEIAMGVYQSHAEGGRIVQLPLVERRRWIPESRPFPYPNESAGAAVAGKRP